MKKNSIVNLAHRYSDYIVTTHCTLDKAAKVFGVPRSTLWDRLNLLTADERKRTKQVALENKQAAVMHLNLARKSKRRSNVK